MEIATFAAGCFWGVQAAFDRLEGIHKTVVGYTGGHLDEPTYREVCTGNTGHAEAIWVEFDLAKITYLELVEFFWKVHDPTELNRQGPDVGSQYRSAIFVHNSQQRQIAEKSLNQLNTSKKLSEPIATEISNACPFWPAEDYHQDYLKKRRQG